MAWEASEAFDVGKIDTVFQACRVESEPWPLEFGRAIDFRNMGVMTLGDEHSAIRSLRHGGIWLSYHEQSWMSRAQVRDPLS